MRASESASKLDVASSSTRIGRLSSSARAKQSSCEDAPRRNDETSRKVSSVTISNRWQSVAVSGNQRHSAAVNGNPRQSAAITWRSPDERLEPAAISGNQRQSAAITWRSPDERLEPAASTSACSQLCGSRIACSAVTSAHDQEGKGGGNQGGNQGGDPVALGKHFAGQ